MTFDPQQTQFVKSARSSLRGAESEFRSSPGRFERACNKIDGQRGRVAIPKIIAIGVVLWLCVLGCSVVVHWASDLINTTAANMQPKDVTP